MHAASTSLVATVTVLAHPDSRSPQAGSTLTGRALAALLAMRTEYADKHYRVVGKPRILWQRVVAHDAKSGRLVLSACVDNSSVHVLDKHGHRVTGPSSPTRVHNLFTLMPRGDGFVVVNVGFAQNPVC